MSETTPGNLRYLCADGEVLRERERDNTFVNLTNFDLSREVTVPLDEPLLYYVTCGTCGGDGFDPRNLKSHTPCPTCDGTGLDESIPLRLVGVGSVVSIEGYEYLLIDPGKWTGLDLDRKGRRDMREAMQRGAMEVVRAVPPAHTSGADDE